MIKEIIESKQQPHQSSGKFSISGVNGCWRKKYVQLKKLYREEFSPKTLRTFKIGDLFHETICAELCSKGDVHELRVVAAEVNIPEQRNLSGRADIILSDSKTGELIIVDVKSCGDWTLNKIKKGECPQNYINQVMLYCHFFNAKRGFLLFFGKHKGEIEEYEVIYHKEKAEALIAEIDNFYNQFVNTNILPPKCDGGIFGCEVCDSYDDDHWDKVKGGNE